MTEKWSVGNQEEMRDEINKFIGLVRSSPKGNDPEVIKILNRLANETDLVKHYKLITKLVFAMSNEYIFEGKKK